MDCTVSVVSQSLGLLTLKIREYFEFCPDWYHRNSAVRELVMQYYVVLRSLLRVNPTLRRCLCRCRHCQIFFLSHPRNAGRRDLSCPLRMSASAAPTKFQPAEPRVLSQP